MSRCLTNLTENPCKMCLPLGVVTAVYGIEGGMNLLHGSQGCSTYIRRHMATHYNEPIDIASSSLSEEGAVFGGEKNLIKGLDNLIKLYKPQLVAVSTTCLAETIGEDVLSMIQGYKSERPGLTTEIVAISSPGYGGTHYEGWFKCLSAIMRQLNLDSKPNGYINVIPGPLSPADTSALKEILEESSLPFIIFPDISENLDGAYNPVYNRLPGKGTPKESLIKMAGARVTLELSRFAPEEYSPGAYLEKEFGVPLVRLNPPVGLSDTDAFFQVIKDLGGKLTDKQKLQRGRLMDAMCDSHKYSALGRAGVAGDPDFVYSSLKIAAENGLPVLLATTGSKDSRFSKIVEPELCKSLGTQLITDYFISDQTDFAKIEEEAKRLSLNLFIGSSDARRMCAKLHMPLIRLTFPIHDHVGGQRVRTLFYQGSLGVLDSMVNQLVSLEETSFRKRIKSEFLLSNQAVADNNPERALPLPETLSPSSHPESAYAFNNSYRETPRPKRVPVAVAHTSVSVNTLGAPDLSLYGVGNSLHTGPSPLHPCFSLEASHSHARLHLPVAKGCNISCNYCRRDMDCPNESRPGVTSDLLSPEEALERFRKVKAQRTDLSVVGIAGPGEALFDAESTLRTLELIRREDPQVIFCLSTNGLMLPKYIHELYSLGLRHLTVTINAVDPQIAEKVYAYADFFGSRFTGLAASSLLIANQLTGVSLAKELGMAVKVNTVLLKGINESHAPELARKLASLGADLGNVMQLIAVEGTGFYHLPKVTMDECREIRWRCGAFLPQMTHCRQCRADAVGLLSQDSSISFRSGCLGECSTKEIGGDAFKSHKEIFKIAVVSKSAVLVDNHFGQADRFYIYESDGESLRLLENRKASAYGGSCGGSCAAGSRERPKGHILELVNKVSDCQGVVAMRIGESPKRLLEERGLLCFSTYETVEKAVLTAAASLGASGKRAI